MKNKFITDVYLFEDLMKAIIICSLQKSRSLKQTKNISFNGSPFQYFFKSNFIFRLKTRLNKLWTVGDYENASLLFRRQNSNKSQNQKLFFQKVKNGAPST